MLDAPHARYTSTEVPGTGLHILDLAVKIKKKKMKSTFIAVVLALWLTLLSHAMWQLLHHCGHILPPLGKLCCLFLWAKFNHLN